MDEWVDGWMAGWLVDLYLYMMFVNTKAGGVMFGKKKLTVFT